MAQIISSDTTPDIIRSWIEDLPVKEALPLPTGKIIRTEKYRRSTKELLFHLDPLTLQQEWRNEDR